MKKFAMIVVLLFALSVVFVMPISASPPTLHWGSQINAGQCSETGNLVINVVQTVVNDVDSGEGGNYWAYDNFVRQIQVWEQADGTYCAMIHTEGQFDGQEEQLSPGKGGILSGNENGSFEGGYSGIITGTLSDTPLWPTTGDVGTTDYQCDLSGTCNGYVNWITRYFDAGASFAYQWWGWVYHGGSYGTWVNSVDGNSGDILGN